MIAFIEYLMKQLPQKLGSTIIYSPIKVDALDKGTATAPKRSIAIRTISSPPLAEYFDGDLLGVSFQVLTSSPNQKESYSSIEAIANELRKFTRRQQPKVSDKVKLQRLSVAVEPSFVEQNEAKEYIYTAIFRAELLVDE
ncbi:minor capsid protein [Bacillus paranthracis]|uniref:minor capsid protein n=1 Tax=Bacillus cereus group TaxID=86661 RepID=UPI001F55C924|nr:MULTISPECIES: minor capsid protein [Bacillus cereus group]MCU5020544.1 minor capsid protein [Bacillus paranthracis]